MYTAQTTIDFHTVVRRICIFIVLLSLLRLVFL
jgi:hypothetical protein